jgi:hypothetical protein
LTRNNKKNTAVDNAAYCRTDKMEKGWKVRTTQQHKQPIDMIAGDCGKKDQ